MCFIDVGSVHLQVVHTPLMSSHKHSALMGNSEKYSLFCLLVYTYFYKGKEYWKFDNQRLSVEPGYPRSILKDWMGCNQKEVERSKDRRLPHDDVDIMVTINDMPSTVNAIAVVIPCILSLCILVLVYTIFQFKNKEVQQNVVYYKRPVQEWVWHSLLHISTHWADEDYGHTQKRGKNALKSLPNKTTSVTYKFWIPWDGNKQENWKIYRQAALQHGASFLCTALVTCQSRCHPPARSASTRVFKTGFNWSGKLPSVPCTSAPC